MDFIFENVRPGKETVIGMDQLRLDAHGVAEAVHAALENVVDAQRLADAAQVFRAVLVGEGGTLAGDAKLAGARECRDDLDCQAVAERIVVAIGAEIAERQDGDGIAAADDVR